MKLLNITAKIHVYTIDECNESKKKLIERAKLATHMAYAPYSGFCVGAAVLLENGEIISGNNQENAAYPSGLCAERVTVFNANSQFSQTGIEAIAIAAFHDGDYTNEPCYPCGSCRQTLLEVENRFGKSLKVIMYGESAIYEVDSIKDLLPLSFGKESLKE
ncbi:MAG: cytidine deaminase [Prevotella sp.]|jgi:cytidine deaminase|nr:cytidine deaminase [Prevotella sp.]